MLALLFALLSVASLSLAASISLPIASAPGRLLWRHNNTAIGEFQYASLSIGKRFGKPVLAFGGSDFNDKPRQPFAVVLDLYSGAILEVRFVCILCVFSKPFFGYFFSALLPCLDTKVTLSQCPTAAV